MTIRNKNKKVLKQLEAISGKSLTLGNLLWSIRKGEEWTQADLANRLLISTQYLSDIENNRRIVSPKSAADYADKLGYSAEQFVRLSLQDMLNKEGLSFKVNLS